MSCQRKHLKSLVNQGYSIPVSAFETPGAPGVPCECAGFNPMLRAYGGPFTPDGKRVNFYQDSWVPWNTRINPLRIEPEQYPTDSYAYYQTAYNAGFMPIPNLVSSSGHFATLPVQYMHGDYTYTNPQAGTFR
uniref:Uncharacterized protein n=1 Tax=viral metagenome TaxID=1070528 RepID=A0A6C0BQC9_9ZZZZ